MPRRDDDRAGGRRRRSRPAEEEEEDEEECPAKRWASGFFEIEAEEVDSGEEEEDEVDAEDDDFIDKGNDIPDEYDDGERVRPSPMVPRRDEEEDIEAMEKMVNERYGSRISTDHDDQFDEETTEVEQQALLPSVKDPKLWMVKCSPGHERKVAASLMQKTLDKGSELHIISAIALDHLKNYIYIEAYKEAYVKEACKGMRNIFARDVTMVPLKEMSNVLTVRSQEVNISRGDWVRLKRSTYTGDLAKVIDVDDVRRKVTVKVTPRLSSLSLSDRLEGVDCFYKTVSLSSVATGDIQPSIEELENLREIGEADADMATLFEGKEKGCWIKGDPVIVVKGELKNMKGSVEYVEGDIVHIKPKEKIPLKAVAVHKRDLAKYFEPGCHVKSYLVYVKITVFAAQVVESKETSDTHSIVGDGCGNQDRHKFSASRNWPHPASSTKLLPRCGPPVALNRAHSGRHDSMIGCKVKIMRGPYRGYRGCVKGINGQNVRVELEAHMKVITGKLPAMPLNMMPERTERETPLHPQTPLHSMGGQTPWRTPFRTPHPSTPVHHGSGTSAWDQWNPCSLSSPSRLVPTP
ncbi:hypothetical protein Cgig2_004769 [Carnegiea gigantea]|uniref:Transcription elongation factor SPT5 n=1 Tax=Carnegiea gigantea TaxID=171969 RepID=A0A9Q1QQ02_9CARY|nr:hypothetical protein Cgig2_004769 [Carnegiea gigantea]